MHDDPSRLDDAELRKQAIHKLRRQRGFRTHLLVYLLVNGFLALVWGLTDRDSFFWPTWSLAFWGIFVVVNGVNAYRPQTFSEDQIQRQMGRMRASK